MKRYWVGVASREHARIGETGGFCQLGHGKAAPVERLSPGDGLVYYAPRERLRGGDRVQAFVTIGTVKPGAAYRARQSDSFHPVRRDIAYVAAKEAPIHPLLDELTFVRGHPSWGMLFHRGSFEIPREDFLRIAEAMGAGAAFMQ